MNGAETLWTLDELTAQVAVVLGGSGPRQENGRVRDVPDGRTIRFYTTKGLLAPPTRFRGRVALYEPRHLWQIVVIKRLQARGMSLVEVQQRLLNLTDEQLREIADIPNLEAPASTSTSTSNQVDEPEEAFWKATPRSKGSLVREESARSLTAIPLTTGVTLLAENLAPLDEHDIEAIQASAAPLLKLLSSRRLSSKSREESSDDRVANS